MLNVAGEWIGVVVDGVTRGGAATTARPSPAPPKLFRGLSAEYLKGIVRRDERLVIFLDVDQLLSSTERISLQEAGARELAHG